MATKFIPVADTNDFEQLLARSHDAPVLLFKHSLTCPISASAYQEMEQAATDVALVVVQKARTLSQEVAERTGIRHESPQALVLRNGAAVWSASHWNVTADAVNAAMNEQKQ